MTGRQLYAALHLLDRQLIDREGRLCGKVDDLELTETEDGQCYVSALVSGPGALWYRLGRHRVGIWLRSRLGSSFGDTPHPDRVPMRRVSDIGAAVTLSASHTEVGSAAVERWVADHIISHIPGSRHRAHE
jgi:sporulation protein YlmC with PRC-barrel domain